MNRRTLVVAAAAGALLVSGGTAFALATNDSPNPVAVQLQPTTSSTTEDGPTSTPSSSTSVPSSSTPSASTSTSGAARLSPDDAVAIVKARLGGGQVHEVEQEVEHGRLEWKVEISKDGTTYDIRVDAENGNITRVDTDDDRGRGGDDDGTEDRGGDDNGDDNGDDRGGDRGGDDDRGHGGDDSGHGGDDRGGDDKGGDR